MNLYLDISVSYLGSTPFAEFADPRPRLQTPFAPRLLPLPFKKKIITICTKFIYMISNAA